MPKVKNIIMFTVIAAVLILAYVLFLKPSGKEEGNLVSSTGQTTTGPLADSVAKKESVAGDFLSVLLNVKNIKLDESIFSDKAFVNLKDSSITLIPTGDEGRPNPFAPIGSDL